MYMQLWYNSPTLLPVGSSVGELYQKLYIIYIYIYIYLFIFIYLLLLYHQSYYRL